MGVVTGRRYTPTSGMKADAARSIRRLADKVSADHPETEVAGHLRDAAAALDRGNAKAASRHLAVARHTLTPLQLYRHGVTDGNIHAAARSNAGKVDRHMLKMRDIAEIEDENGRMISERRLQAAQQVQQPPPAQPQPFPPLAWQPPPGVPLSDAEARAAVRAQAKNTDQAAKSTATPGQQPGVPRSKPKVPAPAPGQKTAGLSNMLDLVGPKGYVHGWIKVGSGDAVTAPKAAPFRYTGRPGDSGHINAMLAAAESVRPVSDTAANAIGNAARMVAARQMSAARSHLATALRETRGIGSAAIVKSISSSLDKVPSGTYKRPSYGSGRAPDSISTRQPGALHGPGYYPSPAAVVGTANETDLSAQTARLASTPSPLGKPGGPGLWDVKNMELPPYIQHIAKALLRTGRAKTTSQAIAMAKAATDRWKTGRNTSPEVRAASAAAGADWDAKRAIAHAHSGQYSVLDVIELAIELYNPAGNPGQPRVTSGPGQGQFTAGGGPAGSKKSPAKTQTRAQVIKAGTAKGASAKQKAAARAALQQRVKDDQAKMNSLQATLTGLLAQQAKMAAATKQATKAGSTGQAASSTPAKAAAAPAAKASTTTAVPAASSSSSPGSSGTSQVASQITQVRGQINQLGTAIKTAQGQITQLGK